MSARRAVVVGVLVALVAQVLSGCEHATGGDANGGDKGGGGGFPPALVSAAPVASATVPVFIDAIGRCVAYELVTVQPRVTGAITAIHFKDGAEVHPGDPLFSIDARPYQAELDLAEANLAQSRAQLALGKTELERMETLLRTNAVSRQEHDSRKNAVEVADAEVQSKLASVAAAKLNVDFCTIRSPIEGRTGQHQVDLGAVVVANSGALVTVQRQDPIYADFTVSERDLTPVRRAIADETLHAEVRVPGVDGASRRGAITFLDTAVQDATGTVKLRAWLDNKDRVFWPGQFVEVRLVLRDRGALVVPATAVQIGQQGTFVYVIKPDSTVDLRPVTTGQRHADRVIVEKGLAAGESIVLRGQLMLRPGAKVQVAEPAAAPQGATGAAK